MYCLLPYAQVFNKFAANRKTNFYTLNSGAATTRIFFCTYFINILFNIILQLPGSKIPFLINFYIFVVWQSEHHNSNKMRH